MGWRVWGTPYETGDMTSPTISQRVIFDADMTVKACRVWVIAYNNPTFNSLSMKVYSDRGGAPSMLLFTSTNVITKSEMLSEANGVREIYFEFNYPSFVGGDTYHFVLQADGYVGSDSSHLAWRRAYPDRVLSLPIPVVPSPIKLAIQPYSIYLIASENKR